MEQIQALLTQVRTVWANLSRTQQVSVVGVVLITGAFLAFVVTAVQNPNYTMLYSGLSEPDASSVVARLKEQKVPYQLTNNGATINVPKYQLDEVRLDMAGAGLPKGTGTGYESLNQGGLAALGQSEYTQRLNYQRALEGELARTITKLDSVEQARVHLAVPQPSLFVDRERPVTASVVLKVRPGRTLDSGQVTGVVNLVAKSVEGLKAENVSVVDMNGQVLSDADPQGARGNARQYEVQRTVEKNLERDIQAMLRPVLGPDKAVVRVSAGLNWDQAQADSEIYVPPQTVLEARPNVVRSVQTVDEKYNGPGGGAAAGVPGTASNVPSGPQGATAGSGEPTQYSKKDVVTNYEISRTVERIVKAPGAIDRLSVAVFLDGPMDEARVDAIHKIVATAAGVKPERGDVVTVAAMPFERSAIDEARQAVDQADQVALLTSVGKAVAIAIIAIMAALLVRTAMTRRTMVFATADYGAVGEEEYLEEGNESSQESLPAGRSVSAIAAPRAGGSLAAREPRILPPSELEEALMDEQRRRSVIEDQIVAVAQANPQLMADLVRSWLEEDDAKRQRTVPQAQRSG
jgi:flagellar M-ring protein FliF